MQTLTKRILILTLICAILLSLAGCGAQPSDEPDPTDIAQPPTTETTVIPANMLASTLRDEFADLQTVDHQESRLNVARNQEFYVDFAFDVSDIAYEPHEIFTVYLDIRMAEYDNLRPEWEILTHDDDPSIPEGHSRMYIRPRRAARPIWPNLQDIVTHEFINLGGDGEHILRQFSPGESWGFLSHYYLTLHIDPATGERLERPQVTIFTLEPLLEAPSSEFFVTEEGHGGFRWEPVEGADYYLIVRMNSEPDVVDLMFPIGQTTDTQWIHPETPNGHAMNQLLAIWGPTDDIIENAPEGAELTIWPFQDFTVIAVNAQTHSAVGTLHRGEEISARMPYRPAWSAIRQEAREVGGHALSAPSIGLLPTQRPISLANGRTVHRSMVYDFAGAEFRASEWNPNFGHVRIPYTVNGTVFRGEMSAWASDARTYRAELEAFWRHMEYGAPIGGGTMPVEISSRAQLGDDSTLVQVPPAAELIIRDDDRIFANSALSAFLVRNMLAGNEFIDLSQFPESANWEYLWEAFFEAMYQNPLILHVHGARIIPMLNILVVEYRKPTDTILRQQEEIRQIIPQIIAQIITDDMTALEKSIAINQFLVEWAEYDWAALEYAERYDFRRVNPRYYDSFTAYGILINRVGVCSGYAAAFKLLADAAGLDAIVVTGYLEGHLPHAWNRVYIDGHWHTVDVTNNANEFLFNIFLHLPDYVARQVLVEGNRFMPDAFQANFRSTDSSSEYFNITGRFYDMFTIAAALARDIQETGSATLRTYHTLDDAVFQEIAMEVMELLGTDNLYGFHWLGGIWMSDSRA